MKSQEQVELEKELAKINFEVGVGEGKTQKHFLSPIVISQIVSLLADRCYLKGNIIGVPQPQFISSMHATAPVIEIVKD